MDSYIEELIKFTKKLCHQPLNMDIKNNIDTINDFLDINNHNHCQSFIEPKIITNKKILTRWLHAKMKQLVRSRLPYDTIIHDCDKESWSFDITVNKKQFTIDVISESYVFGLYPSTESYVLEIINCENVDESYG